MPRPHSVTGRVLKTLRVVGPLTPGDLARSLGVTTAACCMAVTELHRHRLLVQVEPLPRQRLRSSNRARWAYQVADTAPSQPPLPARSRLTPEQAAELDHLRRRYGRERVA